MSGEQDTPEETVPAEEEVLASRSAARWSVSAGGWPDLPPEVVELLATPVVVTAHEAPEDEDRYPPPGEPCAVHAAYGDRTPTFLAPVALPQLATAGAGGGMPRTRRARRRI
ncbi:MAG TPA: hypothetical protein VJT31_01370 [Rugosimonospora sp.]|nr:hypothetical protein [Rugosimonospora sp.]